MKKTVVLLTVWAAASAMAADVPAKASDISYGEAVVTNILRLDENVTFYCDIQDFPAIIGKNMPVRIKSLRQARTPQENLKLLVFLNDLLFSKNKPVSKIVLKGIERGEAFCLMAEIEVDGRDLCDLLVEQKLAQKITVVRGTEAGNITASETSSLANSPTQPQNESPQSITYVCSKSSKVYHRSTCPHAKRLDMSKAITFASSEEAAKTGRRPCKTCNP